MNRSLILTVILLTMFFAQTLTVMAQEATVTEENVPEIRAYRINPHAPKIDGRLDDAIWSSKKIHKVNSFRQIEPDEGEQASESTLVAVAYDDNNMYVAFWCYDSEPSKIDGQLVRRDRTSQSDRVTFRVDPFHDHQTGNAFEVSSVNVQKDCRYFDDGNADMSWDAVWESEVQRQPWGWTAEMKIPLTVLRFAEKDEHTWGVDFVRYINRKNEVVKWAFTPSEKGGHVSNFGHLSGIKDISPEKNIEILPYMVSSFETAPKEPGNFDGKDIYKNMGFDAKYSLSSNLVLDATVNPDFGQVELDDPVLNLSSFETYFPERRPFFLEGSDLFQTPFTLFYSRRIGRNPNGSADDDDFAYYSDYPKSTTILGALKLTGKLSGGTSIALLSAVTEEEKAEYAALRNVVLDSTYNNGELQINTTSADTIINSFVAEPIANYTILRVKQDILKNSSFGGMFTFAGQDGMQPNLTGGIDWRLSTNDNKWMMVGQVVGSRTEGSVSGYGVDLTFEKIGGKHIRGALGMTIKHPDLNLNRLGFTSRTDSKNIWLWTQYRTNDTWWIIQDSYNNFNFYTSSNYDGITYSLGSNFNTHIVFTNNWTLGGGSSIQAEKYSDRETRGNGLWEWPVHPTYSWWFSLNTDSRKPISFVLNPGSGGDRGGHWWANYMGVEIRPRSNLEFSTGINFTRNYDATRWVTNEDDSSLFADLNKNQISLNASMSVVVNSKLSIQLSAEGYIAGLDYQNYRFYQGGNQYSSQVSGYNSDYNYSALNSTLLLRWEYLPGSTMYMVWTRSRPQFDDSVNNLNVSRDFDRLFSSGANNVFLIKTSYWLNI